MTMLITKKRFNVARIIKIITRNDFSESNLHRISIFFLFLSLLQVLEEGSAIRLVAKRERKFPNGHVKVRY